MIFRFPTTNTNPLFADLCGHRDAVLEQFHKRWKKREIGEREERENQGRSGKGTSRIRDGCDERGEELNS